MCGVINMNEKCFELMEKVEKKQKLTYDEFAEIVAMVWKCNSFIKSESLA